MDMKIRSFFVCLLIFGCFIPIFSEELDLSKTSLRLTHELHRSYAEKNRQPVLVKLPIAILDLENLSSGAKKYEIGQTLAELLRASFADSTVFRVIERKNLGKILEEQNLQLSGLTSGSNLVRAGELLEARAILVGSVSEASGQYIVSVRLADVETGEVIASEQLSFPAPEMERASERHQMEYVEKMGIGIGVTALGYQQAGENFDGFLNYYTDDDSQFTFMRRYGSVDVRYRFEKNFMVSAGLDYVWLVAANDRAVTCKTNGVEFPATMYAGGIGFIANLNAYYVFLFNKTLNLSIGGGISIQSLNYTLRLSDGSEVRNVTSPCIDFQILTALEWFVTPRLALNWKIGYYFGSFRDYVAPAGYTFVNPPAIDISGFRVEPIGLSLYF